MTTIRSLVSCSMICALVAVTALSPIAVRAQSSAPPTPNSTAHVRFWKAELREFPNVRIMFKPSSGKHPATRELGSGKLGYSFDGYTDAPAGRGTLEVLSGTETRPMASLSAELVPGAFMTVLLNEPEKTGNPPRLELIDDGSTTVDSMHSQITVRNLIVGLKDMHLTMGEFLNVNFVSGDSYLQMRGLKSGLYPLRTVGTGTDGKPFDWNIDVDFRQNHRQTLLIYPDPYGRIRPRLIADGESQTDAPLPAKKEEQR